MTDQRQYQKPFGHQPQPYHDHHYQQQQQPGQPTIYEVTKGLNSEQTAIVYQRAFNRFLDFIKIHDLQVLLDFSPKVIKQLVIDYISFLRDEKGNGCGSIKVHLAAILRFFQIKYDDFNLTIKSFSIHLPSNDKTSDDRPYTTEEIAQVIKDADLRSKIVILLMCSTGMRKGALHSIRISDLTSVVWNTAYERVYKVQVYARTRDKYYTFTTPECAKTIDEYLDYRKRCNEVLKDESPLIREQFNQDDKIRILYPRFVTEKGIEYLIDQNLKRSGVRKPGKVHLGAFHQGLFC